jgi:hypothetical protein
LDDVAVGIVVRRLDENDFERAVPHARARPAGD